MPALRHPHFRQTPGAATDAAGIPFSSLELSHAAPSLISVHGVAVQLGSGAVTLPLPRPTATFTASRSPDRTAIHAAARSLAAAGSSHSQHTTHADSPPHVVGVSAPRIDWRQHLHHTRSAVPAVPLPTTTGGPSSLEHSSAVNAAGAGIPGYAAAYDRAFGVAAASDPAQPSGRVPLYQLSEMDDRK